MSVQGTQRRKLTGRSDGKRLNPTAARATQNHRLTSLPPELLQIDANCRSSRLMLGPSTWPSLLSSARPRPSPPIVTPHSLEMSHRDSPCHSQPNWPPPSPRRPSAANYWAAKRFVLAEKTVKEVFCPSVALAQLQRTRQPGCVLGRASLAEG
jgi:hypothetical protein